MAVRVVVGSLRGSGGRKDLKSKKLIGMHWGTFTLTDEPVLEPPKRLEQELKKLNLKSDFFRSPKPGEILQLTK